MIAPVLEELDGEIEGKANIVKVDVDDNQETAGKYGVMSIPTLFFSKMAKLLTKLSASNQKKHLLN